MNVIKLLSGQGLLLAAAGLIVGGGAIAGSGTLANFQATASNPSNVFNSGILRVSDVAGTNNGGTDCATGTTRGTLAGTCATIFNATLRVPTDTSSNTLTITNEGNVDGLISVALGTVTTSQVDSTSGAPACASSAQTTYKGQIQLDINKGATNLATGTLASFSGFSSRTLTAGTGEAYTIKLTFNSTGSTSGDNAIQNCGSSFPLTWTLDQRATQNSSTGQ